ncbi:MAG TPA: GNAT family N-acetyltransferase [Pseudonocardia sp.]|jgi:hypothetical protein
MAMPMLHTYRVSLEARGGDARPEWDRLVAADPRMPLSRTPAWLDCMVATDRVTDATLQFRGSDGRVIVFPRVAFPGRPGFFASPPHLWNLGADASGFVAEGGPLSRWETLAAVDALGRHAGLRTRVVVGRDEGLDWAAATGDDVLTRVRTSHELDLRAGFGEVWAHSFTGKVRSNSRKAERRGVVVESDSTGRLVPVFDALYRRSVERWARERGYPVPLMRAIHQRQHPTSKFREIARSLGDRCTIWIAWRDGQALAGSIVLSRGARATYWRGGMDKQLARATGANELLHRAAIEAACAESRLTYDFGLSQADALRRFKASFGAREMPVHSFFFGSLQTADLEARCYDAVKQSILRTVRVARKLR